MKDKNIDSAYQIANQEYAALGVDTDAAMKWLEGIPVSMHRWRGDSGIAGPGMGHAGKIIVS